MVSKMGLPGSRSTTITLRRFGHWLVTPRRRFRRSPLLRFWIGLSNRTITATPAVCAKAELETRTRTIHTPAWGFIGSKDERKLHASDQRNRKVAALERSNLEFPCAKFRELIPNARFHGPPISRVAQQGLRHRVRGCRVHELNARERFERRACSICQLCIECGDICGSFERSDMMHQHTFGNKFCPVTVINHMSGVDGLLDF